MSDFSLLINSQLCLQQNLRHFNNIFTVLSFHVMSKRAPVPQVCILALKYIPSLTPSLSCSTWWSTWTCSRWTLTALTSPGSACGAWTTGPDTTGRRWCSAPSRSRRSTASSPSTAPTIEGRYCCCTPQWLFHTGRVMVQSVLASNHHLVIHSSLIPPLFE